jgi:hypothetical protein
MRMLKPGRVCQAIAACALLLSASYRLAHAQRCADPLLPADHWAYSAVRRVEAQVPNARLYDISGNTLTAREASERLRAAGALASTGASTMATAYADLLEREFRGLPNESCGALLQTSGYGGFLLSNGLAAPGNGFARGVDWTGAQPLSDHELGELAGVFDFSAGTTLAGALRPNWKEGEFNVHDTNLVLAFGKAALWGGSRASKFGATQTGIVLGGSAYFDGVGFYLRDPIRFPWIFRHLGDIRFETFVSRLDQNGRRDNPWFWAARGSIQPFDNLSFGINRASIFGGEGHPLRLVDVLEMIAGGYGGNRGEFENQIVSVDGRWVIPSSVQPVELYAEWGADDSSGMWKKAPAITAGVLLPVLPGLPQTFAALEGTVMFEKPERGNTYWYRNAFFGGSWSKDEVMIGHPLGGHGHEIALLIGSDPAQGRLRLRARFIARDRGDENTYSPEREGQSKGVDGSIHWRVSSLEALIRAELEDGTGWRSSRLRAGLRAFF